MKVKVKTTSKISYEVIFCGRYLIILQVDCFDSKLFFTCTVQCHFNCLLFLNVNNSFISPKNYENSSTEISVKKLL